MFDLYVCRFATSLDDIFNVFHFHSALKYFKPKRLLLFTRQYALYSGEIRLEGPKCLIVKEIKVWFLIINLNLDLF